MKESLLYVYLPIVIAALLVIFFMPRLISKQVDEDSTKYSSQNTSQLVVKTVELKSENGEILKIANPLDDALISSPLEVKGEARGSWYFEASFPVYLYDDGGKIVASGFVTAQGDWMTEDYVPFTAVLEFDKPSSQNGVLVLEKSNPSDLVENSDSIRIPVKF